MIQRKQSVFLLLAVVVNIICLYLPVGTLQPEGMGVASKVYNLCIVDGNGTFSFHTLPLFLLLAVETVTALVTIFLYKNRKRQMKLCTLCLWLTVLWYCVYAGMMFFVLHGDAENSRLAFGAVLPLVSAVLVFMARNGIKADEALVRASERLR